MARRRCTKTGPYDVSDLTISLPVAKIGGFRTVLGCHLTQGSLKSLGLPTTFQAEDEGSIPFTSSNFFSDLTFSSPTSETKSATNQPSQEGPQVRMNSFRRPGITAARLRSRRFLSGCTGQSRCHWTCECSPRRRRHRASKARSSHGCGKARRRDTARARTERIVRTTIHMMGEVGKAR